MPASPTLHREPRSYSRFGGRRERNITISGTRRSVRTTRSRQTCVCTCIAEQTLRQSAAYRSRDRVHGSRLPFPIQSLTLLAVPAVPGDRRRGPAAYPVGHKMSGCETRLTAIVLDEATIASTHALSNHRSAEPIDKEQRGAAGENVTATKLGFQAVTWNLNANDLFACKWLRAPATTEIERKSTPRSSTPCWGYRCLCQ